MENNWGFAICPTPPLLQPLAPQDFMRMVGEILEENRPRGGEKDWLTIAREEAAIVARENAAMPMPMWTKVKTEDPKVFSPQCQ